MLKGSNDERKLHVGKKDNTKTNKESVETLFIDQI